MKRNRVLYSLLALLLATGWTLAGENADEATWTGWVTDTHCGARRADSGQHGACAKKCVEEMNAKYALYIPADKKVIVLEPKEKVAEHAGMQVRVKGKMKDEAIQVESIERVAE
jgi:hypothetical protein